MQPTLPPPPTWRAVRLWSWSLLPEGDLLVHFDAGNFRDAPSDRAVWPRSSLFKMQHRLPGVEHEGWALGAGSAPPGSARTNSRHHASRAGEARSRLVANWPPRGVRSHLPSTRGRHSMTSRSRRGVEGRKHEPDRHLRSRGHRRRSDVVAMSSLWSDVEGVRRHASGTMALSWRTPRCLAGRKSLANTWWTSCARRACWRRLSGPRRHCRTRSISIRPASSWRPTASPRTSWSAASVAVLEPSRLRVWRPAGGTVSFPPGAVGTRRLDQRWCAIRATLGGFDRTVRGHHDFRPASPPGASTFRGGDPTRRHHRKRPVLVGRPALRVGAHAPELCPSAVRCGGRGSRGRSGLRSIPRRRRRPPASSSPAAHPRLRTHPAAKSRKEVDPALQTLRR